MGKGQLLIAILDIPHRNLFNTGCNNVNATVLRIFICLSRLLNPVGPLPGIFRLIP